MDLERLDELLKEGHVTVYPTQGGMEAYTNNHHVVLHKKLSDDKYEGNFHIRSIKGIDTISAETLKLFYRIGGGVPMPTLF